MKIRPSMKKFFPQPKKKRWLENGDLFEITNEFKTGKRKNFRLEMVGKLKGAGYRLLPENLSVSKQK